MRSLTRALIIATLFSIARTPFVAAAPAKAAANKPQTGPRVVTCEPATGSQSVDPGLNVLKITFSEPMKPNQYYLGPIEGRELPDLSEPVSLSRDGLTFTITMALRPGRKYGVAINAPGHSDFRSAAGKPARPYSLFFNTSESPAISLAPRRQTVRQSAPIPQGFRILTPSEGAEVRDQVAVTIPSASVPAGGDVVFSINDRFIVGMHPRPNSDLLEFNWDTKRPLPGSEPPDKRIPKDGPYTITAVLHDASGEAVQTSQVRVNLRNSVRPADATTGLLLRYQFMPDQDLAYLNNFESTVIVSGGTRDKQRHSGEILNRFYLEEKLDSGAFSLIAKLSKGRVNQTRYSNADLSALWALPRSTRLELDQQGMMRINSTKGTPLFEALSILLPLPTERIRIGQSWNSAIVVPELVKGRLAMTSAKHTLEGIEWQHGQETARIRTDYQVRGIREPEASKYLTLATGYPVTTSSRAFPKGSQLEVRGQRYTYFAYKIGRVMRVQERKTLKLVLPPSAANTMGGQEMGMNPGMQQPVARRTVYDIEANEVVNFVLPAQAEEEE